MLLLIAFASRNEKPRRNLGGAAWHWNWILEHTYLLPVDNGFSSYLRIWDELTFSHFGRRWWYYLGANL